MMRLDRQVQLTGLGNRLIWFRWAKQAGVRHAIHLPFSMTPQSAMSGSGGGAGSPGSIRCWWPDRVCWDLVVFMQALLVSEPWARKQMEANIHTGV